MDIILKSTVTIVLWFVIRVQIRLEAQCDFLARICLLISGLHCPRHCCGFVCRLTYMQHSYPDAQRQKLALLWHIQNSGNVLVFLQTLHIIAKVACGFITISNLHARAHLIRNCIARNRHAIKKNY